MKTARYRRSEIAVRLGVSEETIVHFIRSEWVHPPEQSQDQELELDEEDLARCRLIRELKEDLGANDEAIPIILQLLDRVHCLELEILKIRNEYIEIEKGTGRIQ
ncbi:MAG: hypothetical protein A2X94_12930 [Bdellovibrionales bacterium GWB1_55_8]|nr:MAG: hypothetical protein A2X94_12930 [Bdellovibrionales bacterium GWB1_55_8]